MKLRLLALTSLFALVGCGGNVPPGEETEKGDFSSEFSTKQLLINSNFHVDQTVSWTGPELENYPTYCRSTDFDNSKIKVVYGNVEINAPYYFDFDEKQTSESAYSFKFYQPYLEEDGVTINYGDPVEYKNKSLDNSFMGLSRLATYTEGFGLNNPSGLSYSDFKYEDNVYKMEKAKIIDGITFEAMELSFLGGVLKNIYMRYSAEILPTGTSVCEARYTFSQFGQVKVTLPDENK